MGIPYLGISQKPQLPYMQLAKGFDLSKQLKVQDNAGGAIYEFIGSDDFGPEWRNRVTFEVDQGRSRVPLLYEPLYDIIESADLPETQEINNFGPGGFVFEEIVEGEEAKFGHITSSKVAVSQRQFAVGVEYTKKLVMFNQLWQLARIERYVGESHNALMNHLHLYPIISQSYGGPNTTAAVSTGDSVTENWFLTIENAIVNSQADTTNPRNGPYALLVHPSQNFMLQRALTRVPQEGFQLDSTAAQFISQIIGYSGWTGTRGKKSVTYPGVTLGEGYLINLAYKDQDFISLVKQSLASAQGNADVSRFILEQTIWDVWLGIYANPLRAVEKITFPS